MRTGRMFLVSVPASLFITAAAAAQVAVVTPGPSTNPLPSSMRERLATEFDIPLPGPMTGPEKRDAICNALAAQGFVHACDPATPDRVNIHDRSLLGHELAHVLQQSGSPRDKIAGPGVPQGSVRFEGLFDPFAGPTLQPAIFTAGIVTDVGELAVQLSAQELNFQTDGPIICQALFQRLAPRAPQFGATINYAGDRLEVYFDPAYTVTQGGVIFGTTSLSPGASGTIVLPPPHVEVIYLSGTAGGHCIPHEQLTINFSSGQTCLVPLDAGLTPVQIRDRVLESATGCGHAAAPVGDTGVIVRGLALDSSVAFDLGRAAIAHNTLMGPGATGGTIQFALEGFDDISRPTACIAGLTTDLGTVIESVLLRDLPLPADGPVICQALFQRLAPRAPEVGAAILLAGDRLEVYFDPAYSIIHSGIILGTDSCTHRAAGTVHFGPRVPPNPCPADFNADGNLDPDDLADFITCFFAFVQFPGLCPQADFNGDGNVDPDDLADFITAFFAGC